MIKIASFELFYSTSLGFVCGFHYRPKLETIFYDINNPSQIMVAIIPILIPAILSPIAQPRFVLLSFTRTAKIKPISPRIPPRIPQGVIATDMIPSVNATVA
jgi:hypothetical protein